MLRTKYLPLEIIIVCKLRAGTSICRIVASGPIVPIPVLEEWYDIYSRSHDYIGKTLSRA